MIQLKNVSKYYYSKGMIASGISKVNLKFEKGEFVVITGESGSGKTTLLNVISGLDSYEDGEMYIDGKETSHFLASDFEEYRKKYIGNIFQSFNLVNSYTVYQNVELVLLINGYKKEEIKSRVNSIIKKVGLSSYAGTKVSKLSGGQKQRVAIARALAKDTDIIVADEPTGNLDSVSAAGIVELLSEISKDKLVIVVTHNYEQFEAYATRKIKMYDGKVTEDIVLSDRNRLPVNSHSETGQKAKRAAYTGSISVPSKIRLGVRNTFNVVPKFILLLIVFVFVVAAVTSEYTSFQHNEAEMQKNGYNQYFYNYSYDRVIIKKTDGSQFTDDDFKAIETTANIKSVEANDILLDNTLYLEGTGDNTDFSYEVLPYSINSFKGKLVMGRMPENDNEVVLSGDRDDYFFEKDNMKSLLDKDYKFTIGEDKESTVKIVGLAYKKQNAENYIYGGNLYMSDNALSQMLENTYNYNSKIKTVINGKEQVYTEGSPLYRIVASDKVSQGQAITGEEVNNFYEKGDAKGKSISVTAENIYYTETVNLKIADVYTKKTFESKTGAKNFDENNGAIYISRADYNTLFGKGNYQATVYVDDAGMMDETKDALVSMGYEPLAIKDTLILYGSEFLSIIQVPMAILIVLAVFFIAYFVIRLILRSRNSYFSILRMLGLTRKNIRRIMDVELFTVTNIAYAIFLAAVVLVNTGVIDVEYLRNLIEYMKVTDYVILYGVVLAMSYLISGKFTRSLFKKSAMGTFREED